LFKRLSGLIICIKNIANPAGTGVAAVGGTNQDRQVVQINTLLVAKSLGIFDF